MIFTYKKWLVLVFSSLAVFCLLYPLIIYFIYFPITQEIVWINGLLNEKEKIAGDIRGNKLVFGGGSGTLYGVRTKDIQDEWGIPSVNMAVHAGLDIDYYLHVLKKSLKKGDIVILPLEYTHFIYNGEIDGVTLDYVMRYDRNFLNSFDLREKMKYIASVSPINIGILAQNYLVMEFHRSFFQVISNINLHGDGINNVGSDRINKVIQSLSPVRIQQDNFIETLGMQDIKNFDIWCKNNDIKCYISYANTIFFKEYKSIPYRRYFQRLEDYFRDNNISTLGKPQDFFFDKNLFFDTQYHLNEQGMTIRTRQLMKLIESCGVLNFLDKNSLLSQHPNQSDTGKHY
jgi:hypothetical protein